MTDQKDPEFTEAALELIRVMASDGAYTQQIRNALRRQEGLWWRDDPIIMAAAEMGFHVSAKPLVTEAPQQWGYETMAPKRVPDRVNKIAPGTYPARGFTMMRGRT